MAPEYIVVSAENNPAKTGMALHSRRAFRPGELIFTEKPLIIIKNQPEAHFMKDLWKWLANGLKKENDDTEEEHPMVEAFKLLSGENQRDFLQLYNCRKRLVTQAESYVCGRHRSSLKLESTSTLELLGIYLTNLQFIHDDSTAVFKNISRINHNCAANAYLNWNQQKEEMEVIAARDIPMSNVAITIDYSEKFSSVSFTNAKDVRDHCCYFYGFWCRCLLCLKNIYQENMIVMPYSKYRNDDATKLYLDQIEETILENGVSMDKIELNTIQGKRTLFCQKKTKEFIRKIHEFPSRLETLLYNLGIGKGDIGRNNTLSRRLGYHTAPSQPTQIQPSTEIIAKANAETKPESVLEESLIELLQLSKLNKQKEVTSKVSSEAMVKKIVERNLPINPGRAFSDSEAELKNRPKPPSRIIKTLSGETLNGTTPLVRARVQQPPVPYGTFNPKSMFDNGISNNSMRQLLVDRHNRRSRSHQHLRASSVNRSRGGYSYRENIPPRPRTGGVGCFSNVTQNFCGFKKGTNHTRKPGLESQTTQRTLVVNDIRASAEGEALAVKVRGIFDRAAARLPQALGLLNADSKSKLPFIENVGTINSSLGADLWWYSGTADDLGATEISPKQIDDVANDEHPEIIGESNCQDLGEDLKSEEGVQPN